MCVCVQLAWLGLELEFVVVRNVVEEVERKMLPNFDDHRRSPELVAGRRCRRRSRRRENVFGGEKYEEFNGISFKIFGGVLDRFEIC